MSLLSIKNLHLHYATNSQPLRAVNGVSLELQEGEALGIVGESGSGKTSLSLALMRLLPKNIAVIRRNPHWHAKYVGYGGI